MEAANSSITAKLVDGVLPLFYLVPPSRSSFENLHEVPNYVQKVSSCTHVYTHVPRPHPTHMALILFTGGPLLLLVHLSGGRSKMATKQNTAEDQ